MKMHNKGVSFRAIAEVLTETKVPTKKRGVKWHHEMVRKIIERYVS